MSSIRQASKRETRAQEDARWSTKLDPYSNLRHLFGKPLDSSTVAALARRKSLAMWKRVNDYLHNAEGDQMLLSFGTGPVQAESLDTYDAGLVWSNKCAG